MVSSEKRNAERYQGQAAKPRSKPYKMLDGGSLLLLVTPSGGKLGRWNYLYDGKQKSMAFRAWPLVSLADAREVPRRRRRYRR
ncbi:Arm DNA-binding domain-containing protein [Sphingopyxis sp. LARHCG72]